jgi:hypothetical protein
MGATPILPPIRPHNQYLSFVQLGLAGVSEPCRHQHVKYALALLDLSALRPLVAHLYSPVLGAPARPPEDMLRSLLAMALCGVFSIDDWVDMMRSQPFYALISGFDPNDVPGVGTFFLFCDRLLGLADNPPKHIRRPKPKQKDTQSQSKDKNSDTAKHHDIINLLANRLIKTGKALKLANWTFPADARFHRYEAVLKAIFYTLFVPQSVALGLIDLQQLYVTGDSTKVGTYANPHGKRLCSCPKDKPCRCPRRYQDLLARWGWDSYRETFVYGHSLFELCAYSLDHTCQLPLVIGLFDANRHDSVLGIAALHEAIDKLQLPVKVATFDKASDALGFYRLGYEHWETTLIVALNKRNEGHYQYPQATLDEHGMPQCPASQAMVYWGHCRDRGRLKWRCPWKANPSKAAQPCEKHACCSPSAYGRVVYTYPKSNYRLFTPIPRGGELWEKHYDHHSASERSHKRKKWDYGLRQTRTAGRERIFLRVVLMAMAQHLAAWAALSVRQAQEQQVDPAA